MHIKCQKTNNINNYHDWGWFESPIKMVMTCGLCGALVPVDRYVHWVDLINNEMVSTRMCVYVCTHIHISYIYMIYYDI